MIAPDEGWVRVVCAGDCTPCPDCDEPVCPVCLDHYADCACPGPTMDDEYDYQGDLFGGMWARPKGDA